MQQTPVHDRHNPDLLAMIPPESAVVVEVGCSSGALAREFKRLKPDCFYIGVEIDPHFASLAQRYVDHCYVLDIEQAERSFFEEFAKADVWIFGDTLEHLRDPWKVLEVIAQVKKDNGHVLACIPNAQHWSLQVNLALGSFFYQDSGLLDRTHLRWFTRKSILQMFSSSGMVVKDLRARVFQDNSVTELELRFRDIASRFGGNVDELIRDSKPLQYLVLAA